MKAKGHWVWLVAKERKLGVNDEGVNDEGLGVKAVPRAAAVYDRQLKIIWFIVVKSLPITEGDFSLVGAIKGKFPLCGLVMYTNPKVNGSIPIFNDFFSNGHDSMIVCTISRFPQSAAFIYTILFSGLNA